MRHYAHLPGCAALLLAGCAVNVPRWDLGADIPGWTPAWFADHGSAEARARETGQPLLIYFKNADPWKDDPVEDALRGPLDARTQAYVRCILLRANEPDRRFVGQFKVAKAPALVVVHPDGTYHAFEQELTQPSMADFLDRAQPPGDTPVPNPFIERASAYSWHHSLEEADRVARETGRALLIVLDRPYTRDWERLSPMLHRPEVLRRFGQMVHARPNAFWKLSTADPQQFGVTNLPAIVLVQPDGRHAALELPNSYEAIVRFADRALASPPTADSAERPSS